MERNRHTQTVLFSKLSGWTKAGARTWLREHAESFTGGKYASEDIGETADYFTAQQAGKNESDFRYVNEVIEKNSGVNSIILVLGYPRGSNKAEDQWSPAANVGDSYMSLTAKIVELEATIAKLQADLVAKDTERADAVKQCDEKKAVELKAVLDQLATEKAEHQKTKDRAVEQFKTVSEALDKCDKERKEAVAKLELATADLEKHKAMLVNPAMQAAAKSGRKEAVADATVDTAKEPEKKVSRLEEYRSAANPMIKTALWNKYEKEIKSELAAENKASK